ncbi:MAG: TIGR00269 family protein [Candidatus Bathyarchaeota archaeon]|nr:TIGR00269 family protein [Candidatus Bathyarchaeota archaeon]
MIKCTVCGLREAFYVRRYSGEKLCVKCFLESIEGRVKATIAKYNMLRFNDRIAVAVSGGKDSTSLLYILAKIERDFPMASLYAITVDEGIMGYRDEAIEIASEHCRSLGVKHFVTSFKELYGYTLDDIVKRIRFSGSRLTPCSYCGVLRRKALNMLAAKIGATKIATAHNLDDEVQTFLLNIIHGDFLRISRTGPSFDEEEPGLVPRVKPLCETLEKEVALYAYLKGIRFQENPCPYAGEALRNDVRNMVNRLEEKHPGTKYKIYRSAEKIRGAVKDKSPRIPLNQCKICGEPTVSDICQACNLIQNI